MTWFVCAKDPFEGEAWQGLFVRVGASYEETGQPAYHVPRSWLEQDEELRK